MRRATVGPLLALALAVGGCGPGSGNPASMGEFSDSKTELGALFDRLKDAGAVRILQQQVDADYKPEERDVFDVHFTPLIWRDRTYVVETAPRWPAVLC